MSIFRLCNPNNDVFNVEGQEGYDSEDNRVADIGDATLKHIDLLGNSRVIYDSFIQMPDGNLFQVVDNLFSGYKDDFDLDAVKDLEKYAEDTRVSAKFKDVLKEEIQNEVNKRDTSEDALNQRGALVPYADWEANPGLIAHWDIPSTPKPHIRYVGNSKQMFYDHFPDDHPDAKFINQLLMSLNIDWDAIGPKYAKSLINRIQNSDTNSNVKSCLTELVNTITYQTKAPESVAVDILEQIDRNWGAAYFKKAKLDEYNSDPIYKYFVNLCGKFDEELKNGVSQGKIFAFIKLLGKKLFKDKYPLEDKGIKQRLKKRHWALYHRMKKRYAPKLMVNGVDINKADRHSIVKALSLFQVQLDLEDEQLELQNKVNREKALKIAFNIMAQRPFEDMNELKRLNIINYVQILRQVPGIAIYLDRINVACEEALSKSTISNLTKLPAEFIKEQKISNLPQEHWKAIWECYNLEKTRVVRTLRK